MQANLWQLLVQSGSAAELTLPPRTVAWVRLLGFPSRRERRPLRARRREAWQSGRRRGSPTWIAARDHRRRRRRRLSRVCWREGERGRKKKSLNYRWNLYDGYKTRGVGFRRGGQHSKVQSQRRVYEKNRRKIEYSRD